MKRLIYIFVMGILAVNLFAGCGKKKPQTKEIVETERVSSETEAETEDTEESNLPKDVAAMIKAMQKTSELDAFRLHTKADVKLNGNLIQGNYLIDSDIEIVNDRKKDDLLMKMNTISDMDGEETEANAYYQDGWYYTEDEKGHKKEEKTSEEVLASVTDITGMVIDAAEKIQDMIVTADGADTVYTYTIPTYDAEKYFAFVIEKLAKDNPDLTGTTAEVDEIQLVSHVNQEGLLTEQGLTISGNVLQTIFKIPAEMSVDAAFEEMDAEELVMPENYD